MNRADAQRLNAIFGYLPQITLTANQNQIEQEVVSSDNNVFAAGVASYGSTDITFEISQPIFDLSRIFGIRIANTVRTNAEVDYIATVQTVMYEVFDTYVQALQADNSVNSLRRRQALLRRQLNAERNRVEEGLTRQNALRGLEIELAELGISSSRRELDRARLLSELSLQTGTRIEGVTRSAIPNGISGTERRVSVKDAVDNAMLRNPTVLRSLISVTEADLRNKQARAADFSPVLVAFARQIDEDREDSRFGGGSVTSDTIMGVRLVVPIFNSRGVGYANIETRVDLKDSLLQYVNERREVEADVTATHKRMGDLAAASSRAQSAVRSNRALITQEKALVEAGDSQSYIVSAYESRALEAQAQAADLRLEYVRAWARFSFLTGQNLGKR
jgi:outer membrane protein TolC